jgi:surfeit locus 1 family protein
VRRLLLPAFATIVACMVLTGLGVWQLERLWWKEALIERVNARLALPPVPAPPPAEGAAIDLALLEYQPVTVTGVFDHPHEIHVVYSLTEPKGRAGGPGYFVVTPLKVSGGAWVVYVNRGFVPQEKRDPAARHEGQVAGEVTITGLLRQPAVRSWFMPGDDAAANAWFSRDPALYSVAQGQPVERVAPYIIDAAFNPLLPGGLPQGGETIVAFPNSHLGYAITWFGLALCCAGVFAAFARTRLREKRG